VTCGSLPIPPHSSHLNHPTPFVIPTEVEGPAVRPAAFSNVSQRTVREPYWMNHLLGMKPTLNPVLQRLIVAFVCPTKSIQQNRATA
jgi:hypothetical protein